MLQIARLSFDQQDAIVWYFRGKEETWFVFCAENTFCGKILFMALGSTNIRAFQARHTEAVAHCGCRIWGWPQLYRCLEVLPNTITRPMPHRCMEMAYDLPLFHSGIRLSDSASTILPWKNISGQNVTQPIEGWHDSSMLPCTKPPSLHTLLWVRIKSFCILIQNICTQALYNVQCLGTYILHQNTMASNRNSWS